MDMDLDKRAKKITDDILMSMGQKDNPIGILLVDYIKIQLEIVESDTKRKMKS